MCTLTIVPTESGYLTGMNRDELRTRTAALPQLHASHNEVNFISPRETAGGTWIACNERGSLLALLNWNLPANEPNGTALISRGAIIPQLVRAADSAQSLRMLEQFPLHSFAPFRLVAVFPKQKSITELRWDGHGLSHLSFPWQRGHWFSSSLSDEAALRERGRTCELAARQWPTSQSWLRRLHRSHAPHAGAFSVCVHREDAVTVSYTEVCANADSLSVSYLVGSPCQKEQFDSQLTLALQHPAALAATP
jgi:Transport and Golgi organisation 2